MVRKRWICVALVVLNVICYAHVCVGEFINFDDPAYVVTNPNVTGGLSWANTKWAFGDPSCRQAGFWIPVAWLSLQLDATLFGPLAAWGYHLSNLLLHVANVTFLFLVLERLTGDLWRSAIAAALYSIHPLRVESVAWITERKDVLCLFFLILAVGAYHRYTQKGGVRFYVLAFLAFFLGLMSKPTLVTFPFVLLLLDYWPLGRLRVGQVLPAEQARKAGVPWWRLVMEKMPFFVATAVISVITFHYSRVIGGVSPLSWGERVCVALSGYLSYVEKTLWPTNLAALYPLQVPSAGRVAAAVLVLGAITAALVWLGRRKPMLLFGWLWFLGTLFPVSGVAQMGLQGFADRFTYVPHIGIAIMAVWGVGDLPAWSRLSVGMRRVLIGSCLAGLAALTWMQGCYWFNSGILFEHALSVTERNYEAHFCLSSYQYSHGDLEKAGYHAARAVEIDPNNPAAQLHYGTILLQREEYAGANVHLRAYMKLAPRDPDGYYTFGWLMFKLGRWQEAKENLHRSLATWGPDVPKNGWAGEMNTRQALPLEMLGEIALHDGSPQQAAEFLTRSLHLKPDLGLAHHFLGVALGRAGDWSKAESSLQQAILLEPKTASYRGYLAFAYARQGKKDLAEREYAQVLNEFPHWLQQTNDLAMRSITQAPYRDQTLAEELALQMCEATAFKDASALNTLAAVTAAGGHYEAACATAQEALRLPSSDQVLHAELENRLHLYQRRQALPVEKDENRP